MWTEAGAHASLSYYQVGHEYDGQRQPDAGHQGQQDIEVGGGEPGGGQGEGIEGSAQSSQQGVDDKAEVRKAQLEVKTGDTVRADHGGYNEQQQPEAGDDHGAHKDVVKGERHHQEDAEGADEELGPQVGAVLFKRGEHVEAAH